MATEIPIVFIGNGAQETEDRVLGSPCIAVEVLNPPLIATTDAQIPCIRTWALLDTGADHFYVDRAILDALGCAPTRQIAANAVPTTIHSCAIHIPQAGFAFHPQEVAARNIRAEGQPFGMILGRRFFEFATLSFDIGTDQNPSLKFHGKRERVTDGQDT